MLINHSNPLYTQYYRTDISRIMHSSSTLTGADLGGVGTTFCRKVYMSSLSPTFILSVHARFSMSDSFVDLPQEVVN